MAVAQKHDTLQACTNVIIDLPSISIPKPSELPFEFWGQIYVEACIQSVCTQIGAPPIDGLLQQIGAPGKVFSAATD